MLNEIIISRSTGGFTNTELKEWKTTHKSLIKELSIPVIGNKDGSYYLRCAGTKRNNTDTADIAGLLILDGDSRIDDNGKIRSGAPCPLDVHKVLTSLEMSHLIYSSHSNGATKEELEAKNIDSGGLYGADYHKYRIIIPCVYSAEQLPALLDYLFAELNRFCAMLAPVTENKSWSQPWYFPRVPDDNRRELFKFYQYDGASALEVETIHQYWLGQQPQPEPPKYVSRTPQQGENLLGWRDPIQEFNQSMRLDDVLNRNGYKQAGKSRYIRPDSESKIPGVVIMRNCSDGVERVFSHGGDALNDSFTHDAFDCFRLLEHGGNLASALHWNPEITKHNQRLYIQNQPKKASQEPPQQNNSSGKVKVPFSLAKFSLKGRSNEMAKRMLDDKFILGRLAIMGQATAIYSKPNSGKTLLTLRLLIDAIRNGGINAEDVFYINADDNYKGIVTKLQLAEAHGFHMLAPGHGTEPFRSDELVQHMRTMVAEGSASGKVIVLDTLKKFTDLMAKKAATDFMRAGREFISNGGTLIVLAHTNKNRDGEGKVVFGGTSDIVDDVDCAYTLDVVSSKNGEVSVLFENIKSRGDVVSQAGFTYSKSEGQAYQQLIDSVKPLDERKMSAAKKIQELNDVLVKNAKLINSIICFIRDGVTLKSDLINATMKDTGESRRRITDVINRHTGSHHAEGHRWYEVKGEKNAKGYAILSTYCSSPPSISAQDYQAAKDGEF